ncbi:hypothetical protein NE237_013209 [Protea cynaroides]|uniref:CUE domain-containing protein n=1 Tax=Protea cynaroides TaxID=273540 RepID=A0A9Q0H0J1_9MAGN|nr:hypothetical protein NE237_013209 [Protea cynaroides]
MSYNSVFQSLQEVFPQVDIRVLKAVAIEHSKDIDTAVECVLFEVLPNLRFPSESHRTLTDSQDVKHSIAGGEEPELQRIVEGAIAGSPSNLVYGVIEDANDIINTSDSTCLNEEPVGSSVLSLHGGNGDNLPTSNSGHLIVGEEEPELQRVVEVAISNSPSNLVHGVIEDANDIINTSDLKCLNEEEPVGSSVLSLHGGNGDNLQTSNCGLESTSLVQPSDDLFVNTEEKELISLQKNKNVNVVDGSDDGSLVGSGSFLREVCFTDCCNDVSSFNIKDLNELVDCDSSVIYGENHQDQSCLDVDSFKVENLPATIQFMPSSREGTSDSVDCGSLSAKVGDTIIDFEKPDSRSPSESVSGEESFENGSSSIAMVSHSSQICSIDLLEDSIGEAKNNKKNLFLAMESVINKMKELEFQEEVVEQAKREAARGDLEILTKVEDLEEILQHAKEANDMHAGEVYGEKAILATEVREFQSRIQNLSDERDKSLAILKEMSRTLEIRLAAAEEETKMAKQEKLEKEKLARVALAERELAMERVVDESKRLQQQAEENSKLRDFLMDRGRVVDILQGEIAVICQDVNLLKEKFDAHVPISKSLSSSQTSCILASLSSSIKSQGYDQFPENVEASEAREKTSPALSVVSGDTKKFLDDDEWEFLTMRS